MWGARCVGRRRRRRVPLLMP
eukprot:COSAG01_NODE_72915_length_251_cov_1.710526_1_plen_20_part_01